MKIKLIKPTELWKDAILDYKAEFVANGETIHGSALLGDYDSFDEWYRDVVKNSCEETVADGWVPSSTLLAVDENDRLVGFIDMRHRLNDYLAEFGGHIGYSVRKSERRKGYATQMLTQALEVAKELGIDRVLLTCEKDNTASAATMVKCGGVFESEVYEDGEPVHRYWIEIK